MTPRLRCKMSAFMHLVLVLATGSPVVAQLNYTIDCSTFNPQSKGNTCQDYGSDAAWASILSRQLPDWCEYEHA